MKLDFGVARGLMWSEIKRSYGLRWDTLIVSKNGFHYPVYPGCRFYRVWRFMLYVDVGMGRDGPDSDIIKEDLADDPPSLSDIRTRTGLEHPLAAAGMTDDDPSTIHLLGSAAEIPEEEWGAIVSGESVHVALNRIGEVWAGRWIDALGWHTVTDTATRSADSTVTIERVPIPSWGLKLPFDRKKRSGRGR